MSAPDVENNNAFCRKKTLLKNSVCNYNLLTCVLLTTLSTIGCLVLIKTCVTIINFQRLSLRSSSSSLITIKVVQKMDNSLPLKNDLVLRAARGEPVERTPVWIMRQAGRYLPEFQEVRAKHPFFEVCQTPALACEITLQPIRRFDLDAAIIFSDILVIPQALNVNFDMHPGKGPVSNNPLRTPDDLKRLNTTVNVHETLQYVYDAITLTRKELAGKVPLLGFAGGPWTLMAYMIEGGGGSPTLTTPKRWLYQHTSAATELLEILTRVISDHLIAQIDAGAQMVQVFESSTGVLDAELFARFVAPYLKTIRDAVRAAHPSVPVTLFARGALHFALDQLPALDYDVLSLDWNSIDVAHVVQAYQNEGKRITLQGNLDPVSLFAPAETLEAKAKDMMRRFDVLPTGFGHIANLGHGIYPETPVESVAKFIEVVHEWKRET